MCVGEIVFGTFFILVCLGVIALINIEHEKVNTGSGHSQIPIGLDIAVLGVPRVHVNDGRHRADYPLVGTATVKIHLGPLDCGRLVLGARRSIKLLRLAVHLEQAHLSRLGQRVPVHHLAIVVVRAGRIGQPREVPIIALEVFACVHVASTGSQVLD